MFNFKQGYYADIRVEDRFSTAIYYENDLLKDIKEKVIKRAFIRVFDGKMWYYSSTTDIDEIQQRLDRLYDQATFNEKIERKKVVKRIDANNDVCMQFSLDSVRNINVSKKKQLLLKYYDILKKVKYSTMRKATYLDRNSIFEFYSSKGAYIKYDYQTCGLSFRCDLVDNDKFFNAFYQFGDCLFNKLSGLGSKIKQSFDEQVNFMLNSVSVEAGEYPVILSPETAGVFAHESFGHKSEADFMLADEGIKNEWQIGKQVASKLLSIIDSGKIKGSGYCPYDDEGTKATKTYLIRDGILAGRLHNSVTSVYLNEKKTGNARAVDCTFEPIVRMTTTYIEKGDLTKEQLFKGVKFGYYIKSIKHGSGMSKFTLAPHVAYEIKDGVITRPVKISIVTGNVFTTLGLIDGLSNKVELLSFVTGGCGKDEQMGLPVGFGGPYVRVSKMFLQWYIMEKEFLNNNYSEIAINLTDGKVDSYRELVDSTKTVRVYQDNKIGVAGCFGKEESDIQLENRAIKNLDKGIEYVCNLSSDKKVTIDNDKRVIDKNDILKISKRLGLKLKKACPNFLFTGKIKYGFINNSYKNTKNVNLEYKGDSFGVDFNIKDRSSSNIADLYYGADFKRYGKVTENNLVNDVSTLYNAFYTQPVTLENGEYPIIVGKMTILSNLIKDLLGEFYVSGGSLLSGKLNKKLFNENLNVYFDRNPKTISSIPFYDSEGGFNSNFRTPLIEKGVLKCLSTCKNSSKTFNLPLSNTAFANYDGVPCAGFSPLYVKQTHKTIGEIVKNQKAVFVAISSGGDITNDGQLGLPVQLAFLVENGVLTKKLTNFSLSANVFDILGNNLMGVCNNGILTTDKYTYLVSKMKLIND